MQTMRALIFADRGAAALAPLNHRYAMPMLPIAGKELILYTLEDLVAAGLTDCTFVLSEHAHQVEQLLGDGQRWGASFRYLLSRGDEAPSAVWSRISKADDRSLLILRGDLLRTPVVADFLALAEGQACGRLCGVATEPRASLVLLRPGHASDSARLQPLLDLLHGDAAADPGQTAAQAGAKSVPLPAGDLNGLSDLRAYHGANLDLVGGQFRGLAPAGREVAVGLIAGRFAKVAAASLKQGRAYVGEQSRVDAEAELRGRVVIARDVIIDRAAIITDSLILPHTYVGARVEVSNAIIAGAQLIRVDTGAQLTVVDAFLLSELERARGSAVANRALDRVAGALLLVFSLPLWPLALAASMLERAEPASSGEVTAGATESSAEILGKPVWRTEYLVGNRHSAQRGADGRSETFYCRRFATEIPLLAHLPRLLAVLGGQLRLFGVAPLTPQELEARTEAWQHVRDQAPVGLLGPTQLLLPTSAPLDERLMSDAFYASQRSRMKDLRWLWEGLRALLSSRAWRRSKQPAGSGDHPKR